ncbi:hypothetical protein DPMN_045747 [Dreissena polymorpha]|uniref:Uncharacterized protein n=1 Tax=Dreissena polymorpha TaxID=45954 RepID=A0A9D4D6P3_DREPO|nr:hypothetical protein DPMN_045747 [Dreissena polymorpha]
MLSQSSALSERNLTFIERHKYSGKSSGQKSGRSRVSSKDTHSIESFYIDYGDGVLHDTNEIPRIKDCSRPWCNPHCKTCRNRATSRPCFVLVPKTSDVRKSKLPVDKRRASIFPRYAAVQSVKESSKETEKEEIKECSSPIDIETEQPMKSEKTFGSITNDNRDEAVHSVAEVNDDLDDTNGTANDDAPFEKEIQLLIMQRKAKAQKQGYSRKRLEELSQPRGGPPAEVRFSKMSLRKKQEQLKEHVRTKQLTQRERDHLTYIQGKISLFCALINEHELTGRSAPLIGISVSDGNSDGRVKSAVKRKAVLISTPRRD